MVLEKRCYLCGVWIREDQMGITRIPLWATSGKSDMERWKDTDAAMAFLNDQGEIVTLCLNCALTATEPWPHHGLTWLSAIEGSSSQ
jgi:hypothetical protein